jgi:hypothetical protein
MAPIRCVKTVGRMGHPGNDPDWKCLITACAMDARSDGATRLMQSANRNPQPCFAGRKRVT